MSWLLAGRSSRSYSIKWVVKRRNIWLFRTAPSLAPNSHEKKASWKYTKSSLKEVQVTFTRIEVISQKRNIFVFVTAGSRSFPNPFRLKPPCWIQTASSLPLAALKPSIEFRIYIREIILIYNCRQTSCVSYISRTDTQSSCCCRRVTMLSRLFVKPFKPN